MYIYFLYLPDLYKWLMDNKTKLHKFVNSDNIRLKTCMV